MLGSGVSDVRGGCRGGVITACKASRATRARAIVDMEGAAAHDESQTLWKRLQVDRAFQKHFGVQLCTLAAFFGSIWLARSSWGDFLFAI